jgi:hypothetical protein
MRKRTGWGVVAAVMAAAVGVGCGREAGVEPLQVPEPVDGSETQVPAENPVPVPDTVGEAPPAPDAPEAGWWQFTPEASPITFEVPACVQVNTGVMPRFPHPCSVKRFWDNGDLASLQRYDVEGHLVEDTVFQTDRLTRFLYDDSGRLGAERVIEDGRYYPMNSPPYSVRRREVKRYFHSCGGELLFEEQDTNEDGVRDGWRELVRDAAGNLRVERFLGTSVSQSSRISRIEYDYGCHE